MPISLTCDDAEDLIVLIQLATSMAMDSDMFSKSYSEGEFGELYKKWHGRLMAAIQPNGELNCVSPHSPISIPSSPMAT